jgi:hypothetical protein
MKSLIILIILFNSCNTIPDRYQLASHISDSKDCYKIVYDKAPEIKTDSQDTVPKMILYIDTSSQVYTGDLFHSGSGNPNDTIAILHDNNIHWMKGYVIAHTTMGTWANPSELIHICLDENKKPLPKNYIVLMTK